MECFLGTILLFAGSYTPEGFHACDGSSLSVRENQALYAVVATKFGGDGVTTFKLPKLDAPAPGLRYIICTTGMFPSPA